MRHLPSVLASALVLLLAGAGAAQALPAGYSYDGYSTEIQLVPGGVVVQEASGHNILFNRIDTATGDRTTLAKVAIDKRVKGGFDDALADFAVGDSHIAVAFAQDWVDDRDFIHALGGNVFVGAPGGKLTSVHACAAETGPAPFDLDGDLLVYAARTTCGPRDDAKFDLVARDLKTGQESVVAKDLIVGEFDVSVHAPYVAVGVAKDTIAEGYGRIVDDLRVYDVRTAELVTQVHSGAKIGVRTVDVNGDGRLVSCDYDSHVLWAARGATQLTTTPMRCYAAHQVSGDRVFVDTGHQGYFYDLTTGQRQLLGTAGVKYGSWSVDSERVAWTSANCISDVANVVPLSELQDGPFTELKLRCPSSFGSAVHLRGRTARVDLTCPAGCTGALQLYAVDDTSDLIAETDVDPEPGKKTTVSIPLDKSAAARLRQTRKVKVSLYSDYARSFHSGTRTIKHSG